ncbi:PLAT/LH2 domain-containing protein [Bacillus thuringiensis]|uniref:PLAT/LH2 domain-containing protein n=1 Tax=Bacillus thuringiensis TaxID=1428 RepID=UPI00366A7E1D
MTEYTITVQTSDNLDAGTDANIYLTLHGDRLNSDKIKLNDYISGNAFERGEKNIISIDLGIDFGDIHTIILMSDCAYLYSSWEPEYISINKKGSSISSTFNIYSVIEDKKEYLYFVTLGYPVNITKSMLNTSVVINEDKSFFIPKNTQESIRISTDWSYGLEYTDVNVFDTRTGSYTSVPISEIECFFNANKVIDYLKKDSPETFGKREFFDKTFDIKEALLDRRIYDVWEIKVWDYKIELGNILFLFSILSKREYLDITEIYI